MRIGELAERAGTTTRALRYYESRGLLPARRTVNGHRTYDEADLRLLRQIRTLQDFGFELEETRPFVECLQAGHPSGDSCPGSLAVYRHKLAELDALIDQLGSVRTEVAAQLARAEGAPARGTVATGSRATGSRATESRATDSRTGSRTTRVRTGGAGADGKHADGQGGDGKRDTGKRADGRAADGRVPAAFPPGPAPEPRCELTEALAHTTVATAAAVTPAATPRTGHAHSPEERT